MNSMGAKPGLNESNPGVLSRVLNIQKGGNGKMQGGSGQIPGGFLEFADPVLRVSSSHIFPISA